MFNTAEKRAAYQRRYRRTESGKIAVQGVNERSTEQRREWYRVNRAAGSERYLRHKQQDQERRRLYREIVLFGRAFNV